MDPDADHQVGGVSKASSSARTSAGESRRRVARGLGLGHAPVTAGRALRRGSGLYRSTLYRSYVRSVRSYVLIVRTNGARLSGMADTTPVGDRPTTGGRVKQYADGAERARAWRERQRARRAETAQDTPAPSPALAEASLSLSLDRLRELVAGHQAAIAGEVARVEDAIAALADPEAVAEELATARAETARQVAQAEEAVAKSNQARAVAESAARQAAGEKAEAEEAANGAWERVEVLEAEVAQLRADLAAAATDAQQVTRAHTEALDALRAEHDTEVERLRAELAATLDEARAAQARAEGVAGELRAALDATRAAHAEDLDRLRAEHTAALDAVRRETTERLGATHAAELESVRARAEIDLARAEAKAQGAAELAEARSAEVTRLLAQVEDLRADAGRARDETRRLQAQLDRRSTLPGEPPATPAGTTRRNRPRSD